MNIAIIGAGNIGSTLGTRWLERDHNITFGVRDITSSNIIDLQQRLGRAVFVSPYDALADAEVIVLAVPGKAVEQVVRELASALARKLIIDTTNNLAEDVTHHAEVVQQLVPTAKLFRAFNSLGWENFATLVIAGHQIDHFYCGDDEKQQEVQQLISDTGLNPIYLGGLEHSPTLDALTRLWFTLAFQKGYGRRVALKIIAEEASP